MQNLKANPGVGKTCESYTHWFQPRYATVNLPAVQDQVAKLHHQRGREKYSEVASILHAVTCLDLTTLSGDDTLSNVQRLCHKAVNPIQKDLLKHLGFEPNEIHVGAVCVYPSKVKECIKTLETLGSNIPVAAVAAGFPSGQYHLSTRLDEIRQCILDGAKEIDIVVSRDLVLSGEWEDLFHELELMREACGEATLKTIIAAGELGSVSNIYKTSIICMAAGADFIKTSTGKESVNATLPIGMVMTKAIRDYYESTGFMVGFKPAGGIRTTRDVLLWQDLIKEQLGSAWLNPKLFRIGASSLLGDIEQNIFQFVSGFHGGSKYVFPYL